MAGKHCNENFIHECGLPKEEIKNYVKKITDMGFDTRQIMDILDFYLFYAPILKSDANPDLFGCKSLREYGWCGNSDMSKLEGRILKASGIGVFCFVKAESISQTLQAMDFGNRMCVEHPRAVLKHNYGITVNEDGTVVVKQRETRMECLFRHIRNSIAHNHTYLFPNDNLLIEDADDNRQLSARILMPRHALVDWMDIVKDGV